MYAVTSSTEPRLSGHLYILCRSSRLLLHFSTANRVPTTFCGDVELGRIGKGRPPPVALLFFTLPLFFPDSYIAFDSQVRAGVPRYIS